MKYRSTNKNVSLLLSCFILWLLSLTLAFAHDGWLLNKQDIEENISIYYRTHNTGNVEFRGEMTLETSVHSCIAILRDVKAMPSWVYNVKYAKVLEKVSELEAYSYVINTVPFPLTQRDSIIHTVIDQDPETFAITLTGFSVPDYIAEKDNYVRIVEVNSYWRFTPLNKKLTKIVFQGYGEPGGYISADIAHNSVFSWLAKTELWKLPFYTLKQMKSEIRKDKYQKAYFDFLKDLN